MMEASVCVEGLLKRFGTRTVFQNLDFEVPQGACLVIWGPNGAGKSTLLRIIATLERATAGTVRVAGYDVRKEASEVRTIVGLLGHTSLLYPELTALENLELYARLHGVANPRERGQALLDRVGLTSRSYDEVKSFSRGMTQRLSLARALVGNPAVLLLDEPHTGLDAASAQALDCFLTAELSVRTCLMVTHDADVACRCATHLLLMGDASRDMDGRFVDLAGRNTDERRALLGTAL